MPTTNVNNIINNYIISNIIVYYITTDNEQVIASVNSDNINSIIIIMTWLTNAFIHTVATPYLGMVLVFMGFGSFQVSETAIKQAQNLNLMRDMQSTGQTDPP